MPTGKVKWYDSEKGFGFLSREGGEDVYVRSDALPAGVGTLKPGTRVEFGIVAGRRGDQALQVRVLDPTPSIAKAQANALRKSPEEMGQSYRHGRRPEGKSARQVAQLLRRVAGDLEG